MLVITLVMLPIVVIAVLVVTFVAFPHRGEDVPKAPWLGEAMSNLADVLPTLDNTEEDEAAAEGRFVHVYVDNTDPARPVTPMPDVVRAAVEPLLRG